MYRVLQQEKDRLDVTLKDNFGSEFLKSENRAERRICLKILELHNGSTETLAEMFSLLNEALEEAKENALKTKMQTQK